MFLEVKKAFWNIRSLRIRSMHMEQKLFLKLHIQGQKVSLHSLGVTPISSSGYLKFDVPTNS